MKAPEMRNVPGRRLGVAAVSDEDLEQVVSAAVGRRARVQDWEVTPVDFSASAISTDAVLRVHGVASAGTEHARWDVLVKVLRSARHWPHIAVVPDDVRRGFIEAFPWREEARVLESDLSRDLPPGIRTPRVFRIDELGDDRIAMWMEYVHVDPSPWTLETYDRAAHLLGRWAGRRGCDAAADAAPASSLREMAAGRLARGVFPQLAGHAVWAHPVLRDGGAALRADLLSLAQLVPSMLDRLAGLPQAIGHGDACPQNLLVPADAPETFVAIDVSFQQPEALGFDLGQLLMGRAHSGDLSPSHLPHLHDLLLRAYVAGLREEGCPVDVADVAYGFDASLVIRSGFTALPFEQYSAAPRGNTDPELAQRAAVTRYLADVGLALPR